MTTGLCDNMPQIKQPSDYDDRRQTYYLGRVLPGVVEQRASALNWSASKLLRVTLYEKFNMMKELADELGAVE
jgi:hypothetical protein